MGDRTEHWNEVYETKDPAKVSWFEAEPAVSLNLIRESCASKEAAIIDIGAGVSRLAGALVADGYRDVSALDISKTALDVARGQLPADASVDWIVADARHWTPARRYDLWHDRAAFHFLTEPADQEAYLSVLDRALRSGGHAIIGTFATGGPEKCSGLRVQQYNAETLTARFGPGYRLIRSKTWDHKTPFGTVQRFHAGLYQKV